jgi:hypothetical protein
MIDEQPNVLLALSYAKPTVVCAYPSQRVPPAAQAPIARGTVGFIG